MQSQVYTRYIQFSVYTKEKLEFLFHMSFYLEMEEGDIIEVYHEQTGDKG